MSEYIGEWIDVKVPAAPAIVTCDTKAISAKLLGGEL